MRRALIFLAVLFLCWSLLPGGFELAENLCHLAAHGDLAHEEGLPGHLPFDPEHGCGGGFHLCSCCHVQPSMLMTVYVLPVAPPAVGAVPRGNAARSAIGFPAPLEEPPRA